MKCWVARSHSKTHIRIQLEPFTVTWPGWDLAESTISLGDPTRLVDSTDDVEIERLHQECWLRRTAPLAYGLQPAGESPSLA